MLDVRVTRRLGAVTIDAAFATRTTGVTALFGPSGSGKTSVVNMVAGLIRPDRGHVRLNGETLFDSETGIDVPMERRRLGYVFQEGRLFPHMTVRANLVYGMRRTPPAERRVPFEATVELLGIAHLLNRRPARLSGGEKQRVALGRALLTSPRLLLMDEPLAALDANRKEEVLPFLARLPREFGIPVLYVTHSMDEILRLADVLVLMETGRSAAVGAVEDLLNRSDLRHLTGRHEPAAVLAARVLDHDEVFGLSRIAFCGGTLVAPRMDLRIGTPARVRILARDVTLALEPPRGLSVQNVFTGTVVALSDAEKPFVDVQLDIGCPLIARVTERAAVELDLAPGKRVHALVKAVSIARTNVGEHEPAPDFASGS